MATTHFEISQQLENTYTLPVYRNIRLPLTLVRGVGSYVYDDRGNAYLDLYGGHAVCSIGHSHPIWVERMKAQIEKLTFYSNAAYCEVRAEAAEELVTHSYPSMDGVFFCNSGAEANETALKIARKGTGRTPDRCHEGRVSRPDARGPERDGVSEDARTVSREHRHVHAVLRTGR